MVVDIYIRERKGSRQIRIPWLPEEIECKFGGVIFASYDIIDRGPVSVPTGTELAEYSWTSEFPGKNRNKKDPMMRGSWKSPESYHKILEDWKAKGTPLKILVTGYPINKDVLIKDYSGKLSGAFGDIVYDISLIEDRDITITSTKVPAPKRPSNSSSSSSSYISYTIKSGDTLWDIAQLKLGSGAKWQTIYNANESIIESTAKKHGFSSSSNGHWIFPGVVIKIPK